MLSVELVGFSDGIELGELVDGMALGSLVGVITTFDAWVHGMDGVELGSLVGDTTTFNAWVDGMVLVCLVGFTLSDRLILGLTSHSA